MAKIATSFDLQVLAESALLTQEKPLKVKDRTNPLFIGIPRETQVQENRICLTPESVKVLTNNGHIIWLEAGAGLASKFSDSEYSEAGAKIVYSQEEIYKADIILKVAPPTLAEIELMQEGCTLISAIQMAQCVGENLKALNKRKLQLLLLNL